MSRLLSTLIALSLLVGGAACGSTDDAAEPEVEAVAEPETEAVAEPVPETEAVAEAEAEPDSDSPPAPSLERHEVLVLAVHDDPLLRSEQRLLDVIEERMGMRRIDALEREATEAEAAFARAYFGGDDARPAALPPSVAGASIVVFLRFPPNRELDRGQRATRGLGGVLAFRTGETGPYFEARIDDASAWRSPDEQVWPWLISLVRAEVAS